MMDVAVLNAVAAIIYTAAPIGVRLIEHEQCFVQLLLLLVVYSCMAL
jgi:hypothetical protein